MTLLHILELFNHGLVLLYGVLLSAQIAGGWDSPVQRRRLVGLCPVLLAVQAVLWYLFGNEAVRQLYPLITHLPLILALIFLLKKTPGVAVVSVATAYLCCQLPRWVSLAVESLLHSELVGEILYTLSIVPIFFLLLRYFVRPASSAMTAHRRSLLLFGSLPAAYYLFDYATAVYADFLELDSAVFAEFLPTSLIVFYVAFLTAYHVLSQDRAQAQLQSSMLDAELEQSRTELETLRRVQNQTAIYQHDMRHHLTMVESYLSADRPEQAAEYVRQVLARPEHTAPQRYCGNDTVNLLCSAFSDRANQQGIRLDVDANLPQTLSIPDTELCAVISNGLENALHAVETLEQDRKWVRFYCHARSGRLLLEIRNPYDGDVTVQNGLPVSHKAGHGYGCGSIASIVTRLRGVYAFEPEKGLFTLRVVLPLETIDKPIF